MIWSLIHGSSPRWIALLVLTSAILCQPVTADAGDAKSVLKEALKAMGGDRATRKVKSISLAIDGDSIREYHRIRLKGRMSIYTAKRPSGRRLEVILARGSAFIVDRDKASKPTAIEDLKSSEVKEAGYDRDLFLLPLLLPVFIDSTEAVLRLKPSAPNGDQLVEATLPPASGSKEQAIRYTLRFSSKTKLLIGAKSVIPAGPEKGRGRIVVYRGYKQAAGILLPRELRYKVDTESPRTLKFRLKLNNPLPLTLFLKPRLKKKSGSEK
ncbi:MAG: hypothetical protein P1V97_33090 [Planctomycetota bacterium]|nr:hypothetical protein [Planctomycetota bacterium]